MSLNGKFACPRCNIIHTVVYPTNEIECSCHLYCEDGDEPDDCSVTAYNYSGTLKYPFGAHSNNDDLGADRMHATGYCATHNKYVYKDVSVILIDWKEYLESRVPPGSRLSGWKKG